MEWVETLGEGSNVLAGLVLKAFLMQPGAADVPGRG
jgi:hypothetical protein